MNGKKKFMRVSLHVDEEDYKKLRSSLILKNKSFSAWVRIIVKDFLIKEEIKKKNEMSTLQKQTLSGKSDASLG